MQALEVGHLGRIAGFGQSLETSLDELHRAATQHRLLTEQIGLGFFAEVGFNHTGLAAAIGRCVAQRQVAGFASFIGVHGDKVWHTAALGVG